MGLRFGRLPVKQNAKTPRLSNYLLTAAAALAIPAQILWYQAVAADAWPMYYNDQAGDCTFAAVGHLVQSWSANCGGQVTPDPQQILQGYIDLSGYDPRTGANDTGCAETDVLDMWASKGIAGNKADCWAATDPRDLNHLKLGTWYFGGMYLGLKVTNAAQQQFAAGQPWQRGWFDRIDGEHAVPLLGYDDAKQLLYVGTWARVQAMTYDYWYYYGDESYVVVNPAFIKTSGVSPVGLNLDQMRADRQLVAA